MIRNSISRGALALCLLATPLLAIGDHHKDMEHRNGEDGAQHQGDRRFNAVQRAEKHLRGLEQKLNLKAEQKSAWDTYSSAVMAGAREQQARMEEFRGKRGAMRDLDTATKLERMSEWTRERADRLDQMAKDTRAFQQTLTTEQQTIFDRYWRKHAGRGMARHRQ